MSKPGLKSRISRWLDDWRLAGSGLMLATKELHFWLGFIIAFLFFGTLLNLLAGGTAAFGLMASVDFGGKLQIIGDAFLGLFGVGRESLDWLLYFSLALLQGLLIGLVVVVWRTRAQKQAAAYHKKSKTPTSHSESKESTKRAVASQSDNLQRTGLAAGLAVLGSGCPTCGTTLLAPLIGAIGSSGGLALAGFLSGVLTALSVIIALLALQKIGKEAFVELSTKSKS